MVSIIPGHPRNIYEFVGHGIIIERLWIDHNTLKIRYQFGAVTRTDHHLPWCRDGRLLQFINRSSSLLGFIPRFMEVSRGSPRFGIPPNHPSHSTWVLATGAFEYWNPGDLGYPFGQPHGTQSNASPRHLCPQVAAVVPHHGASPTSLGCNPHGGARNTTWVERRLNTTAMLMWFVSDLNTTDEKGLVVDSDHSQNKKGKVWKNPLWGTLTFNEKPMFSILLA